MRRPLQRAALAAFGVAVGVLLISCAGERGRVDETADGPPNWNLRAAEISDATPRAEPRARYGNHSPYEVFGQKYYVMESASGYRERGIASWYGRKFHGRRTSSGEPYDLSLATAAHKTLPLPTYAEVTNLENGKRVIVKINDRGPFKDNRLIDLSYGAALRLDMIGKGTARVEVRAIDLFETRPGGRPVTVAADRRGTWLQAGAYGRREGAEQLAGRLQRAAISPVSIIDGDDLYRVWLGPYLTATEVESVVRRIVELGFERPHRVKSRP